VSLFFMQLLEMHLQSLKFGGKIIEKEGNLQHQQIQEFESSHHYEDKNGKPLSLALVKHQKCSDGQSKKSKAKKKITGKI
jgi:hypothetical protein